MQIGLRVNVPDAALDDFKAAPGEPRNHLAEDKGRLIVLTRGKGEVPWCGADWWWTVVLIADVGLRGLVTWSP